MWDDEMPWGCDDDTWWMQQDLELQQIEREWYERYAIALLLLLEER